MGRRLPHRRRAGRARGSRAAGRLSSHPLRDGRTAAFVEIDTTRPELIPACVALVAHPDDERYKPLFGTEVVTPLFGVRVPVKPHRSPIPEKGTGVAMICTFGDVTDVVWWRELALPVALDPAAERRAAAGDVGRARLGIGRRGRARSRPTTSWRTCPPSRRARGSSSCCARAAICSASRAPITHAVKFYEKGDRPLEILTSRQWFIKTMEFRERAARARRASCDGTRRTCRRGSRTGSTA